MGIADAKRLLNPPKPIGRNERSAVMFSAPATPPQFRPSTGPRPRPTTPIVADRQVVSAYAKHEISKAQTSVLNAYVAELTDVHTMSDDRTHKPVRYVLNTDTAKMIGTTYSL